MQKCSISFPVGLKKFHCPLLQTENKGHQNQIDSKCFYCYLESVVTGHTFNTLYGVPCAHHCHPVARAGFTRKAIALKALH